jgi:hypothetical protein
MVAHGLKGVAVPRASMPASDTKFLYGVVAAASMDGRHVY